MILTDFSKSSEKSYLFVHQQILIEWFPDDQDIKVMKYLSSKSLVGKTSR